MVKKVFFSLILLSLGFTSCKKPYERACFKSAGEETITEISLQAKYDSLILSGKMKYRIIPSSSNKIQVKGGKNVLPFIKIVEGNNKLTISDDNKCDFLRSYKKEVTIDLYVDSLAHIFYTGSSSLKSIDTIRSKEIQIEQRDGAGEMDLTVSNNYTSVAILSGYGNFIIRGKTNISHLNCASNSFCNALDFKVKNMLIVTSKTTSTMKINASTQFLEGFIEASGNILYKGNPNDKSFTKTGTGDFIPL